jgi:hypothetical protein
MAEFHSNAPAQAEAAGHIKKSGRLTGVDLISVAVLGILARLFYYVYAALGILFPYNVGALSAFMLFPGIIASTLVRKRGTFTVYTVSWLIISFLFQGENVAWLLFAWMPIVFSELAAIPFKEKYGSTLSSSLVIGLVYGLSYLFGMILYISLIVKAYFPVSTWGVVIAIGIVSGVLAVIVGFYLGKALKKVIG